MTRSGGTYMVPLLEKYREERGGGLGTDREKRLAFVLGWIAHRAADRFYKTIYRQLDPEAERTHNIRIYHDLVLYEEVYDGGAEPPFMSGVLEEGMESQPGSEALDVRRVEPLFGAKWLQDLLELHSFVEGDATEDWIDTALSRPQYYRLDHQGAYESPDPDKMERFITDADFYDPDDPLVALVRSIQRGSPDRSSDVEEVVEQAITGCQYARSLNLGHAYLTAASEYFVGAIDKPALEYRLHQTPMTLFEGEFGGREDPDIAAKLEDPSHGEPVPPGRITAIAVTDDCRRLVQHAEAIDDPIAESLSRHPDAARLGGVLRSPDEQLPPALRRLRERWSDGEHAASTNLADADVDPKRVAFVAGALCHGAAERHLGECPGEQRLRQDAIVLREFGDGRNAHASGVDAIATLLDGFWLRSLVGLHTLVPDRDDVEGWMDRLFAWADGDEERRRRYADAYVAFCDETEPGFYNRSDRIIGTVRAIHRGDEPPTDVDEAVAPAPASRYAAAVRDGYRNIEAMSEFLQRDAGPIPARLAG